MNLHPLYPEITAQTVLAEAGRELAPRRIDTALRQGSAQLLAAMQAERERIAA